LNVSDELIRRVREAAALSDLVQAVASIRRDGGRWHALGDVPLRPLSDEEIAQLEKRGTCCGDWSRIRVADGFDWRRLSHCNLHGDVLLGRFLRQVPLAEGIEVPAGIYHATIANCVIANDVLIRDVKLLANYVVDNDAVLLDCGTVTCAARTAFGNGMSLPIGVESGGRDVAVYAEIDVSTAQAVASRRSQHELMDDYECAVGDYTLQITSDRGLIGAAASVQRTPSVRNTLVGPHANVDAATLVADCTLLSSRDEPTRIESGAYVSETLLQWGSQVASLAIVERSVLTEHSHVDHHGKVSNSIIGPNSSIAKGEVTACLVGPFVSCHHQALLIATVWPEGKGNVSYGANIGSNHTAKAPDQEFWPGEGAFLGLGVNVKFPADFRKAPYTVLACSVTTLPQRLEFPFSLVNLPSRHFPDISPAYNEIIPAWLLSENLYAVKRNEGKYRARNRARRQQFEFEVFRPEIVDLMRHACRRLEGVTRLQEAYTDREIAGLGKNFLLESNRQRAIAAYRYFVRYYALLALKNHVQAVMREAREQSVCQVLDTPTLLPRWEHARHILVDELKITDMVGELRQLSGMLETIAQDVERSKAKDDERGAKIIDDYGDVHVEAAQDPFVRQTWEETHRLQRELAEVIDRLTCHDPATNGKAPSPSEVQIMIA
jgi:NDP-sugar pyrophosphorylase family protein